MSISLTQVLMQQGYLNQEQYAYAYQIQQNVPVEMRKPLALIYLEQGFMGVEHIEYALKLRQNYIAQGVTPEEISAQMPQYESTPAVAENPTATGSSDSGAVTCKICLSECQSGWAICPFCGNSL